ncbi:hypothetical protein PROVRUST_07468 [Providencia rustigianii DSM 4541]|uniref:Uncharacterized protein n=1 Tax=Providencia rustigianii DSM 4541 TaxID=500637 RepID=D1P5G2_9GAMM|nr:hypothetical protein PROVRUST_07468 [Providencia rustigianii DSM 4541]
MGHFFVLLSLVIYISHGFLVSQLLIEKIPEFNLLIFTIIIWLGLYSVRYIFFLFNKWAADGWDTQRQIDKDKRISIGQRRVTLLAQAMILPHITNCKDLSTQIITSKISLLPPNLVNGKASYCAQFIDSNASDVERVINRIKALVSEPSMLTAIKYLSDNVSLNILVSIGESIILSENDTKQINQEISQLLERPFSINYKKYIPISIIDNWLDKADDFEYLLTINLYQIKQPIDKYTEVSVAHLLSSPKKTQKKYIAFIHRPESISQYKDNTLDLNKSINNALLWGNVEITKVKSIFLNTFSISNLDDTRKEVLFTESGGKIPLYSIDNIIGCTQHVSPWVNLYISTSCLIKTEAAQLAITRQNNEIFVWTVTPPIGI